MDFKNDPRVHFGIGLTPNAINPTHHPILHDWNIPNKGKSRHRLSNKFLLTTTIHYLFFDAGEIFVIFCKFHAVKCYTLGCFRHVDLASNTYMPAHHNDAVFLVRWNDQPYQLIVALHCFLRLPWGYKRNGVIR